MMRLTLILFVLAAGILADDGEKEGRRGNKLYEEGSYESAIEAYLNGLSALDASSNPWMHYALNNNLGAALLKAGDAAGANEAFSRALLNAPTPADYARSAYNAGNAAYNAEQLEQALQYFRESLLREPDNQDAKFNYEFVKRRLEQQQQQQQQQQNGDEQQQNQDESGEGQGEQQPPSEPQDQEQGDSQQDGQQQQQQGEQPEDRQPEQPQNSQNSGEELSREEAQRILQARQSEEEQLLREVQGRDVRPRRVEKDW